VVLVVPPQMATLTSQALVAVLALALLTSLPPVKVVVLAELVVTPSLVAVVLAGFKQVMVLPSVLSGQAAVAQVVRLWKPPQLPKVVLGLLVVLVLFALRSTHNEMRSRRKLIGSCG
jgi:hypothetical protein